MAVQQSRYTLRQLMARVVGDLGLRGQALVTKDDILAWSQEASDALASIPPYWYRTEATAGTTSGTRYYDFPAGLLMVEDMYYDGNPLYQVTQNELGGYNWDWRNESSGTPTHYYRRGFNGYALYPTPNVTDVDILTLHYAALPAIPSDDDDFLTIPTAHDGAIVSYCLYRASLKDASGEGRDRIGVYKAEWERAKAEFTSFVGGSLEGQRLILGSDNSSPVRSFADIFANGYVTPP